MTMKPEVNAVFTKGFNFELLKTHHCVFVRIVIKSKKLKFFYSLNPNPTRQG